MSELAVALPTRTGLAAAELADFARTAERSGFAGCYVCEYRADALAVLAAMIAATSRIEVGTAVTNINFRHPAVLALSIATLDELSGRRVRIGLGSGDPVTNGRELGVAVHSPLARMAEYVDVLRRCAAPPPVTHEGELYPVRDLVPDRRAAAPVALYVAALQRRMMSLATRVADGIVLNLVHRPSLGSLIAELRRERAAGPRPRSLRVLCLIPLCVTDDEASGLARGRSVIVSYALHPAVSRLFERHGHDAALRRIQDELRRGDRPAALASVPDAMVADYVVTGSAQQCRSRLADYVAAGVDLPILYPVAHPRGWAAALAELLTVAEQPFGAAV